MNTKVRLPTFLAMMLCVIASAAAADLSTRQFDLEVSRRTVREVLNDLSKQTRLQVLFLGTDDFYYVQLGPLKGRYTLDEALTELLRQSGLTYRRVNDSTIAVAPIEHAKRLAQPTTQSQSNPAAEWPAQAGSTYGMQFITSDAARTASSGTRPGSDDPYSDREEVIVTGSHIRGINVTSPVMTLTREQIDRSGRSTVQQMLELLPQNFGGGISENAGGTGLAAPGGSFTYGTGVNLRGLGNEATLVLLNGRRLAPTGFGEFVDVSGIPLSAVDRIEVLTDGASAIYGSDAVAGVVNIVLREDYEGAETTARYGTVTSGSTDEVQLGQTFGTAWNTGHVLGTYEYYQREKLSAADRSYTESAPAPLYLLPDQTRHSAILAFSQDLSSRVSLNGSGNYSQRAYEAMSNAGGAMPQFDDGEVSQVGGALGLSVDVGSSWRVTFDGATQVARASNHSYALPATTPFANGLTEFSVSSLDSKVEGPVARLPGGYLRVAAGGAIREEKYEDNPRRAGSVVFEDDRTVRSLYAEALVPIVGDDNQRPAVRRLQLSIAGRYEDYSDFGSNATPKLGLGWDLNDRFRLRTSYGKSFRAPAFEQLRGGGPGSIIGTFLPDDPPAFAVPVIFYQGGNPDLKAETAETWSFGADYVQESLAAHFTVFDIDYRNRIAYPPGGLFNAMLNEELLGEYVIRDPDPALLQSIAADPAFQDFLGVPLSAVAAIVDFRRHNSATSRLRGTDLDLAYSLPLGPGQLGLQGNVQYLFQSEQQIVATAPVVDVVDTVFNPPRLRARAGLTWTLQRLSASALLNYTGAYQDTRPAAPVRVGSWTTVDATLRYQLTGLRGRGVSDTTVALSLWNLFDQDPPFVRDPANSVNFDGANANALGRFVALQVVSRW